MKREDDFRRNEAPPRRGTSRNGSRVGGAADDRGQPRPRINGHNAPARPDWQEIAAAALDRERLRRDDKVPPGALVIPPAVRNRLLRQAWAGAGLGESPSLRGPRARWLLPAAACLAATLAFLGTREVPTPRAPVAAPAGSSSTAQGHAAQPASPASLPGGSPFDGRLLDRAGLPARKEADISFSNLAVIDQMSLEPRVLLSDRFRMAIGVDLTAVEADGG